MRNFFSKKALKYGVFTVLIGVMVFSIGGSMLPIYQEAAHAQNSLFDPGQNFTPATQGTDCTDIFNSNKPECKNPRSIDCKIPANQSEPECLPGYVPPDPVPPQQKQSLTQRQLDFGQLASMLVSIFTPLIAILVNFIGKLMGTEVIYGTFGSSDGEGFIEILHIVWLVIRDLINYVFIIVLLAIGFMATFNAAKVEEVKFELTKLLIQFGIALVGVNFTWFAAMVVLDAANVTTHVVFAIPKTLGLGAEQFANIDRECKRDQDEALKAQGKMEPSGCIPLVALVKNDVVGENAHLDAKLIRDGKLPAEMTKYPKLVQFMDNLKEKGDAKYAEDFGKFIIIWTDFRWERFQENSIAAMFAYNVLQIQNLPRSVRDVTGKDDIDLEDLIINAGFALLIMIVIIIAFVVMLVVLIERIVIIWINLILSPIGALIFVVKDIGLELPGGEDTGIGFKPFVKFAFLPAFMGLPLTLGYILIMAGQNIVAKVNNFGEVIFNTELINGVSEAHHILWYVLAVGVLWASPSIAEKTAIYTQGAVKAVTDRAKQVGAFIGKLPLYWQFIPIGTGGSDSEKNNYSLGGLLKAFDPNILQQGRAQQEIDEASRLRGEDINATVNLDNKIQGWNESKKEEFANKLADIYMNKSGKDYNRFKQEIARDSDLKKEFGIVGDAATDDQMKTILGHLGDKNSNLREATEQANNAAVTSAGGTTAQSGGAQGNTAITLKSNIQMTPGANGKVSATDFVTAVEQASVTNINELNSLTAQNISKLEIPNEGITVKIGGADKKVAIENGQFVEKP